MLAEMWNSSGWHSYSDYPELADNKKLKEYFDEVLDKSGFKILNYVEHEFEPQGFTALWLLSESHFAIHTFPEEDKFYWEISSCVELYFYNFQEVMRDLML